MLSSIYSKVENMLKKNDSRTESVGEVHLVEPSLSAEKFDSRSMFSLDWGSETFIYVESNVASDILRDVIEVNSGSGIPLCIYVQYQRRYSNAERQNGQGVMTRNERARVIEMQEWKERKTVQPKPQPGQ
ncbi:uncharacterized protein LOC129769007 [Toxorhynchites rutilus septentrionalis]|uniref:uncharacterized protein LOC129769007 n=1 Tax=Toxorhynchites rutilus septentrionalis TaxID=329112 RepID=UPI0024789E32|nr:uncharacterized protein LOC129769007 [Toxorhynchites rutilus septentrionalis]